MKQCRGSRTEFPCRFCGQKFPFKSARRKHEGEVHEGFKCTQCNMPFDSFKKLRAHCKTLEHKKKYEHVCSLCEERFSSIQRLKSHKQSHEKEVTTRSHSGFKPVMNMPQKAKEKLLKLLYFRSLDKQNRNTHIVDDYPFSCSLCISSRFVSEEILNLHKKRHESSETKRDKPFACSSCELRFSQIKLLDNHTRHHESNELGSCQICGMTIHRNSITEHLETHEKKTHEDTPEKANAAPKLFECNKCGVKLKKKCNFVVRIHYLKF